MTCDKCKQVTLDLETQFFRSPKTGSTICGRCWQKLGAPRNAQTVWNPRIAEIRERKDLMNVEKQINDFFSLLDPATDENSLVKQLKGLNHQIASK